MAVPSPVELMCATVLYAAARSALGTSIIVNDPYKARASLYKIRNDLNDPELASLMIRLAPRSVPDDGRERLWILTNRTQTVDLTRT